MIKILPIGKSPIKTYTYHAYPLSIIMQNDKCLPWFYTHYYRLFGEAADDNIEINFYINPLIVMFENPTPGLGERYIEPIPFLKHEIAAYSDDPIADIINAISDNQYVVTPIDEYYNPLSNCFDKYHFHHHLMVYGYDNNNNTFNCLCFNKRKIFGEYLISFEDLNECVESECAGEKHIKYTYVDSNAREDLYTLKSHLRQFVSCQNYMIEDLRPYNQARNVIVTSTKIVAGSNLFLLLNDYLEKRIKNKTGLYIQCFTCLEEYTHYVVNSLNFLLSKHMLKDFMFSDMQERSQKAWEYAQEFRNYVLKYNMQCISLPDNKTDVYLKQMLFYSDKLQVYIRDLNIDILCCLDYLDK